MELRLLANDAFLKKATAADERFSGMVEAGDGGDAPGRHLHLADPQDLLALLNWFREGCDADASAELVFPPHLSKKQRAHIHSVTEQVGLGALETFSRGIGDGRYISVMRAGAAPKRELSEVQQHKAFHLYRWAREAGKSVSRDEVADMVFTDTVPSDLAELWNTKSAQQKAVLRLCGAVRAGDAKALKAAIKEAPDTVTAGAWDVTNGVAPLHLAAAKGHADLVEVLLEAGAPIDAHDGDGATAVQLARRHDQSDAEGVLLRAGASDPKAHHFPGGGSSAPVDSALDPAAPAFDPPPAASSAEPDDGDAGAAQQQDGQKAEDPAQQGQQEPQQPRPAQQQPQDSDAPKAQESAHPSTAEQQQARSSDDARSSEAQQPNTQQQPDSPAPERRRTAPMAEALKDAAANLSAQAATEDGGAATGAQAPASPRTAPLAEALRDAAANGPTGVPADAEAEPSAERTLEAEGTQSSVPLAEAVEAYAAAQRGGSEATPSERSVSFAGADAATSATQSELDPSEFAAAPPGTLRAFSGDLRAGAGSAFGDAIPEEEEAQYEDALQQGQPAGPAADGDAGGQLQTEPSLAMGSAELRRPARLNASDRVSAEESGFEFRLGCEAVQTPRSASGAPTSESLKVHPTSSSARSEDSSLAAFGSEAELPAGAGRAAGGGADGAAGGEGHAASAASRLSGEITPAEEPVESGEAAGKMQRLTPELADEGSSGVLTDWLPFDLTSPTAWRTWLAENQGTVAACGAGAAAVAVLSAFLLSSGRRRY